MKHLLQNPNAKIAAAIGGLGGFLLGYNTAVISGVLLVIAESFALSTAKQANVVSILLLGALIGAVAAGFIADKIGRKKTLLITMGVYFLGGLILTLASSYGLFGFGRFITGIGVGLGAFSIPLYLAEIAPPKTRGTLVTINQLSVAFGIFVAYLLNYIFDVNLNYRYVFGFACVFSCVEAYLVYLLPESPSWLLAMMNRKEARSILRQIRPNEDADKIIATTEKHLMNASKDYFMKKIIVPSVIAGLVLSFIHQISGFNAIIYYAPTILQKAGLVLGSAGALKTEAIIHLASATEATIAIGFMHLVCTAFAFYFVDRLGRKPLLMIGLAGMGAMLLLLSFVNFLSFSSLGVITLISLMLYVGFFALSLGSIIFLLIAEIFPLAVRGKVMALCVFVNFLTSYIVSLSFLPLFQKVSPAVCFLVFGIFCLASIYYIHRFIPETKEKTLEDIEKFWKK